MGLAQPLAYPFWSGLGMSSEVPGKYDCAFNGRPFDFDRASEAFKTGVQSITFLRNQADTGNIPGEQSVSPEGLWPRVQKSWHFGAGQTYADADDSEPARYRASKGIDPWTEGEIRLLGGTARPWTSANFNLSLAVAGDFLYMSDGLQVYWTQDPFSDTPVRTSSTIHVAKTPTTVNSITSDGYYVYAALEANGLHRTVRGASASGQYNLLVCTLVAYVNGRLMAANLNSVYNVISTSTPTALFDHPNSDFQWVGFASGQTNIYMGGYSGDKSIIYRTAVKADGTALDVPIMAGQLPDGEIISSLGNYVGGSILIGTSRGLRYATTAQDGSLQIGALIPTGNPVRAFEGQDRFVWFGWTNYDTTSTGLGRLDLKHFTLPLTPAYASDLMAGTMQGEVVSIVTFQNRRVFAVAGAGIWAESNEAEIAGSLDSGHLNFGLSDTKVAMFLDIRHRPLIGTITSYISVDEGVPVAVGTNDRQGTTAPSFQFPVGQRSGELFEIREVLRRDEASPANGPKLRRHTLRARPAPKRGYSFVTAVLSRSQSDFDYLMALVNEESLVRFQALDRLFSVTVEDVAFRPIHTTDRTWFDGSVELKLNYNAG